MSQAITSPGRFNGIIMDKVRGCGIQQWAWPERREGGWLVSSKVGNKRASEQAFKQAGQVDKSTS